MENLIEQFACQLGEFWDDVNGGWLDKEKVLRAREEELGWVKEREVYVKRPLQECWDVTHRAPISLRWVDTNKGDDEFENYRSRIVVRELKRAGLGATLTAAEVFSAMPPTEALRVLASLAMHRQSKRGKPLKIAVFDIRRAHLYGEAQRDVYVDLPEGDREEGMCALLKKSLYGTQDASAVWQHDYCKRFVAAGYRRGRSNGA